MILPPPPPRRRPCHHHQQPNYTRKDSAPHHQNQKRSPMDKSIVSRRHPSMTTLLPLVDKNTGSLSGNSDRTINRGFPWGVLPYHVVLKYPMLFLQMKRDCGLRLLGRIISWKGECARISTKCSIFTITRKCFIQPHNCHAYRRNNSCIQRKYYIVTGWKWNSNTDTTWRYILMIQSKSRTKYSVVEVLVDQALAIGYRICLVPWTPLAWHHHPWWKKRSRVEEFQQTRYTRDGSAIRMRTKHDAYHQMFRRCDTSLYGHVIHIKFYSWPIVSWSRSPCR